jgi:hypothetical protein
MYGGEGHSMGRSTVSRHLAFAVYLELSVLAYLEQAIAAHRRGELAPKLLG